MGLLDLFAKREKRKLPRTNVVETGWIRTSRNAFPHICVIWDLSERGARVAITSQTRLGEHVELSLSRNQEVPTRCRVVWSGPGQAGLEFEANVGPVVELLNRKRSVTAASG